MKYSVRMDGQVLEETAGFEIGYDIRMPHYKMFLEYLKELRSLNWRVHLNSSGGFNRRVVGIK